MEATTLREAGHGSGPLASAEVGSGSQEEANEEDAATSLSCVTAQLLLCGFFSSYIVTKKI